MVPDYLRASDDLRADVPRDSRYHAANRLPAIRDMISPSPADRPTVGSNRRSLRTSASGREWPFSPFENTSGWIIELRVIESARPEERYRVNRYQVRGADHALPSRRAKAAPAGPASTLTRAHTYTLTHARTREDR